MERDAGKGQTAKNSIAHRQRMTNQAAAFLGEIAKHVNDPDDVRCIVRIMWAAVQ